LEQDKSAIERAVEVRGMIPAGGLFAGRDWRLAPEPFALGPKLTTDLESLGRVLLQFYRALNLLYRRSAEGKMFPWVAEWLDQGKPSELIRLQRSATFRNQLPRVIRPDVMLTEDGIAISELDSVPGGIGATQWLNAVYGGLGFPVTGGVDGMKDGFASIHGEAGRVIIIISDESGDYRPEMNWLVEQLGPRFEVWDAKRREFAAGDSAYRFFELFDLANVPSAKPLFEMAEQGKVRLTPPPKPLFEEKLTAALLWNRNLRDYWRRELGEAFFNRMLSATPRSWVLDPSPMPPAAAVPGLEVTDWRQLASFSQRERDLILKVSGFSERAWGARGVVLGSDISSGDWGAAIEAALADWGRNPWVLQEYRKPRILPARWHDPSTGELKPMDARVRLCPYYFVSGEGDAARARLGGVLATLCPADKKIIHGMNDAILAPCMA
jgi:hypothetical protein